MRTEGFILSTKQINDWDKLITVISREGVFPYIINRGFHYSSPFLSVFNTYYEVDFYWDYGKSTEFRIVNDYDSFKVMNRNIFSTDEKRRLLYEVITSFTMLKNIYFVKDEYKIFKKVLNILEEEKSKNIKGLHFAFLLIMLLENGLYPEISLCISCGKKIEYSNYFSIEMGGFLCNDCGKNNKNSYYVGKKLKRILEYVKNHENEVLEKHNYHLDILKNFDIIKKYYNYHFKELK